ncbi:NTP transferase domain-containing protein [Chitinophaga filiformis]|uniref:Nucleotidyltransferase family protein n=1 Tax=Chitinophaga filiformis TaxID=104663 RepID=A0ABY4HUV3_CHIFI|nr:nucleotidyltransferase family protein [Chitinophaga filiformis]UPK66794.1 nucleotidyltransferase family protein [Chitinophaga filiformis]
MEKYGVIILGAGNSSRLGQPKQLLMYRGKTLICQMAEEAIAAVGSPVVLVTGANAPQILEKLCGFAIEIVENDHWIEGMGSSISTGMKVLVKHEGLTGVIIMVCDQPFVNAALLKQLMDQQIIAGKGIIACTYDNTAGTPVLFANTYFDALAALEGQEGAKKILQQSTDDLALVPFPLGALDIDTAEDYQRLLTGQVLADDN